MKVTSGSADQRRAHPERKRGRERQLQATLEDEPRGRIAVGPQPREHRVESGAHGPAQEERRLEEPKGGAVVADDAVGLEGRENRGVDAEEDRPEDAGDADRAARPASAARSAWRRSPAVAGRPAGTAGSPRERAPGPSRPGRSPRRRRHPRPPAARRRRRPPSRAAARSSRPAGSRCARTPGRRRGRWR